MGLETRVFIETNEEKKQQQQQQGDEEIRTDVYIDIGESSRGLKFRDVRDNYFSSSARRFILELKERIGLRCMETGAEKWKKTLIATVECDLRNENSLRTTLSKVLPFHISPQQVITLVEVQKRRIQWNGTFSGTSSSGRYTFEKTHLKVRILSFNNDHTSTTRRFLSVCAEGNSNPAPSKLISSLLSSYSLSDTKVMGFPEFIHSICR